MIQIFFVKICVFYTRNIVDIPVKNDNTCKHPLLRCSMSILAIYLATRESGLINSHVADTIVQPTQEGIDDVSPIKPSPQTHSDQSCPVVLTQQTTPIAPVDPKTSTQIRRASFTPVFTPNNIRVVRDDTENVLTLSDEMNQSKKVSVVNKVNSRNHTQWRSKGFCRPGRTTIMPPFKL